MGRPIAYLITFRTHGTWLHGDIRGAVDRKNNVYGFPRLGHDPVRKEYTRSRLKVEPVLLDATRRTAVLAAISETCTKRNWKLLALNIRTNHVHVVVQIGNEKPEAALIAFKANATRHMRKRRCWPSERSPWVEKGSRRYLWKQASVDAAIDYVNNSQGQDLPFDF
jgi:REP element-mobilizing transposase RayT